MNTDLFNLDQLEKRLKELRWSYKTEERLIKLEIDQLQRKLREAQL